MRRGGVVERERAGGARAALRARASARRLPRAQPRLARGARAARGLPRRRCDRGARLAGAHRRVLRGARSEAGLPRRTGRSDLGGPATGLAARRAAPLSHGARSRPGPRPDAARQVPLRHELRLPARATRRDRRLRAGARSDRELAPQRRGHLRAEAAARAGLRALVRPGAARAPPRPGRARDPALARCSASTWKGFRAPASSCSRASRGRSAACAWSRSRCASSPARRAGCSRSCCRPRRPSASGAARRAGVAPAS